MSNEEKLKIAIETLKKIADNDPGPARFIAQYALDEIVDDETPAMAIKQGESK